jgi:hypothetical protein
MKIPTSYQDAWVYLGVKSDRPAANNTRVQIREGGAVALRLHQTDIVTWYRDGRTVLNSGGWRTPTTKDRINAATSARLSQKSGVWYHPDGHPFADGDTINADGSRTYLAPEITPVVFRRFYTKDSEVIALFPYEPGTCDPATCANYMHTGQHGHGEANIPFTKPARPEEYAELKRELERIGYSLQVLRRFPSDAYEVRRKKINSAR